MRALTFHVLRLLSSGEFHSGEALARRLAVTRASVWNALNEAQSAGLSVQRVRSRGYRLLDPLDWIDAAAVERALADVPLRLEVVDQCASTNMLLLERAERAEPSGLVIAAELQSRGRGRLGRPWRSGLANALTFSLLWRFERGAAGLAGLSLAVGVAIARALRQRGAQVELKWPNDLQWRGRKLGGILIELRGDALGPCVAVIGIGINIRLDDAARRAIDQPVCDAADAGAGGITRTEWLTLLLRELHATLRRFERDGFEPLRAEWDCYHAHRERPVRIELPDGSRVYGKAIGVDGQGALRVERDDGCVHVFISGEVSLRAADVAGD